MTVHDFKLIDPLYTLRADGRPLHKPWPVKLILDAEFRWHRRTRVYEKNIELFLAPSRFVRDRLVEQGFDAGKITVLPLFAPQEFFSRQQADGQGGHVLSFGRLDESKDFDDLIRAFAELKIRGLKLKIAGEGPDRGRLEKLIKSLRLEWQIELMGLQSRDQIKKLIAEAEIVVNCSKVHETFGLAALEAMAMGKAIIASKVGAIPELIKHRQNGLLYDAADAGDLKRQLELLLRDGRLRRRLASAARRTANAYRPEAHAKKLIGLFEKLAREHKPRIRLVHTHWIRGIFALTLLALLMTPFYYQKTLPTSAINDAGSFPKLANLYWKNPVLMSEAATLAKWDLLVLDMQAQSNSADAIREIRRLNPRITILAYTTAVEMPTSRLKDVEPSGEGLWHELAKIDDPAWHLKTYKGKEVIFWPGNVMMNLNLKNAQKVSYADALVNFLDQKVISSGLWDGLFFDNVWATADGVNKSIDIDGDGKADSTTKINSFWKLSQADFFQKLRKRIGSSYILIGNGDGNFSQSLNGRMFESFPEYWEGGWTGSMKRYQSAGKSFSPNALIINSDSDNTGNTADYRAMRFGLASALMQNGYYSFDYGPNLREQFWWYDEYDVNLGRPVGAMKNLLSANQAIAAGLWQREFENGLVLVNSTNKSQTAIFDKKYQRISGYQDPKTNSGEIISQVAIPAQDGIILLKLNK